jgi:hypothetical protein
MKLLANIRRETAHNGTETHDDSPGTCSLHTKKSKAIWVFGYCVFKLLPILLWNEKDKN